MELANIASPEVCIHETENTFSTSVRSYLKRTLTDREGQVGPKCYISIVQSRGIVRGTYIFQVRRLDLGVDVEPLQNLVTSHAYSDRD